MPINYDELKQGLLEVAYKVDKSVPIFNAMQNMYFGTSVFSDKPVISYEEVGAEVYGISEEAVRGLDANRVNFNTEFNTKFIQPAYHYDIDKVNMQSALYRVEGEPKGANWSLYERQLFVLAKKRNLMMNNFTLLREKLVFEVMLTGKYKSKAGGEVLFPVNADLLNVSGADIFTKPTTVLSGANQLTNGRACNTLIMNIADADKFMNSAAVQKLADIRRYDGTKYAPTPDNKGFSYMGTIAVAGCGIVDVIAYTGFVKDKVTKEKIDLLPKGKAIFGPDYAIGKMGYACLYALENGITTNVVGEDYVNISEEINDVLATTKLSLQSAPAPLITTFDDYCVITGIV